MDSRITPYIGGDGVICHIPKLGARDCGDGLHRTGYTAGVLESTSDFGPKDALWLNKALNSLRYAPGKYHRGEGWKEHDDPTVFSFLNAWISVKLGWWSKDLYKEWKRKNDQVPTRDQYSGLLFGLTCGALDMHRIEVAEHIRTHIGIGPDVFAPSFRIYAYRCLDVKKFYLYRLCIDFCDLIKWVFMWWFIKSKPENTDAHLYGIPCNIVRTLKQPTFLSKLVKAVFLRDCKKDYGSAQAVLDIYFGNKMAPPINKIAEKMIKEFYV